MADPKIPGAMSQLPAATGPVSDTPSLFDAGNTPKLESPVAPLPGFTPPPAAKPSGNLSLLDSQISSTATTGTVGDDELVAKQLEKILGANSAYVDQAKQRAYQYANARGLQNSSLAAAAGEEAAISQALPIATQDATTYSRQNLTNQDALNKASLFNASQGLEAKRLGESARQFDANQGLEGARLQEQSRQFNADVDLRQRLAQLDTNTKAYLANTEAKYKTIMQNSASASDMWRQYQDAVARIMTDDKLDGANKQAAIDLLGKQLDTGMQLIGKISGLDLGGLLTFEPAGSNLGGTSGGAAGSSTGISAFYRELLGRDADPTGIQVWTDRWNALVRAGQNPDVAWQQVRSEIAQSPEAREYASRPPAPAPAGTPTPAPAPAPSGGITPLPPAPPNLGSGGGGGGGVAPAPAPSSDPYSNPNVSPGAGFEWNPGIGRWEWTGVFGSGNGRGGEGDGGD